MFFGQRLDRGGGRKEDGYIRFIIKKRHNKHKLLISGLFFVGFTTLNAQLKDGLIAYWPLDEVLGSKTPELVNGYDMELTNLSAEDVVEGRIGNAFSFSNEKQTLLSRVHDEADQLPANKHESHTVSMWSKVDGNGQNDLRLFSEANTGNSDPLFNIGTASNGASGSIDFYIRQSGWPGVNHIKSTAEPYDGEWHHVVFVQEGGERRVYVDGELDALEIAAKPAGTFRVNDTTIGGILRSSASHWVTGLIDDVAIWNRALSDDEVGSLFANGVPTGMKKELPLEILSFDADFPAVAAGGKATLNWDASADASLYVEPKALLDAEYSQDGIVNAVSEFGVGSIEVTVKESTTFTLKAVRGNETVEGTVTVEVISGVADGWTLIDNFESRDEANAEGAFMDVNDTSIGGILRASASYWVTGLIDDVAIWKRALSDEEISAVQDAGLENRSESLGADMIAYWPLDEIQGEVTPDVINGYDLELTNLSADDLVEGQIGNAFSFSNENNTLLSRVHDAADELPANKHNSFTISMWSQVDGNGQNDLRLFSEGNTANNTPLFNIGTDNGGAGGAVDLYIRQGGWPTVGHIYSTAEPYDGEWHHVVFVQENGKRRLYVDGELDDLEIPAKPAATFNASDSINGQGGWQNPVGSAVVLDVEGNQALGFTGADDLNALQLRSLQIAEGEKATVFFRLATLDDASEDGQVNVLFGLTEKPIRFVGDFNNDAGPIVRLTKEPGFGPITLNARNGVGNEYTIGDTVLDFGGVYNIWIDVENRSNDDGDVYSVYIAEEGQAERTVVFENFVSDRNPAGTVDLGKPKPDLMSLLVMSSGLNAGLGNLLFDDLYVSIGKFLDTVPVASAFVGTAAPEIVLHSSRVSGDGAGFSFDWNSTAGNIYQVQRQATLSAPWQTIADAHPTGGATADNTSFTDSGLGASAIYRVAQLENPPLFFDDFESGATGWSASDLGESGTEWELGKPTNGPGESHSPTRAYGTGLAKDYGDYTDVYLVSPVIDLTGLDNARLEFWSYRDCEPAVEGELYDWCQVMILDEDGEYLVDNPIWLRGGVAKQWRLEKAKIPAGALGKKIRLEFNFSSDGGQDIGPQSGWFIDDVAITIK